MRIRRAARGLLSAGWLAALMGALGAPAAAAPPPADTKAEPAKAEPAKAEPTKPEPAKAEPAKAEPAKAEPAKAEPEAAGGKKDAAKPAKAPAGKAAPPKRGGTAKGGAKAPAKAAKPKAAAPSKKQAAKAPRKAGDPGEPDEATRRIIAGTPAPAGRSVRESPELRAMLEIDQTLFPSAAPAPAPVWPADGAVLLDLDEPRLDASGLPPSGLLPEAARQEPARDISWLRQLDMPDVPVRWDGRVVRYLEYYKDNPRGRAAVSTWIKKSGRYGGAIRRILREQGLPEDIVWLALVESAFDPTAHSPAGAAGLWQFMPEGARIYGLTVDRWVDERLDPERSTLAAARYLADLRQRFGGWELAFAAYNMGYGGLLASIRKYNTNDFWELSRLESGMPLETALYVPKIIAMAVVARNRKIFGCEDVEIDPAVTFDKVAIGSGVSLQAVATAAGAGAGEVEALNPQLVARRTPPAPLARLADKAAAGPWEVRVPPGAGARAAKAMPKILEREPKLERHVVRWGESLDDIAARRGTTRTGLRELNGLRAGEAVRPGALLFVPAGAAPAEPPAGDAAGDKPLLVVPAQRFSYDDRRRVFYRVAPGDTLRDVAGALSVRLDDLCRWNVLDPGAALHEGMTLQIYVPKALRHEGVALLEEDGARVVEVGSEAFFAHFEGLKGRKRIEVAARDGDTFAKLARKYGLSVGMLERINHRARSTPLRPGDKLVVYVPTARPAEPAPARDREEDVAVAAAPGADADAGRGAAVEPDGPVQPAALKIPVPGAPLDPDAAPGDPAPAAPAPDPAKTPL